jgi:hypothetical protein
MKKIITILLLLTFYFSTAQVAKEKEFQKTVTKLIAAYNEKNSTSFNKLVHKDKGVYFLVKSGAYDFWYNRDSIQFDTTPDSFKLPFPYNSMLLQQKLPANLKLTYAKYPIFNCNNKKTKLGLFVDTSHKVTLLSSLIKKYIKFNDLGLDKNELKNELKTITTIERKSRKIVIIGKNNANWGEKLIFYLTYIDNKWYITIIDFATFDCSV